MQHIKYMLEAIALSEQGSASGQGGPFGAVIVRDGAVIGRGYNRVLATNDPTAHAEVVAIREASARLGTFHLEGAVLYTSCEPCPMCLGAIYWARIARIYFANTRTDAAAIGFSDELIYNELNVPFEERIIPMEQLGREEAKQVFERWGAEGDKRLY